MPDTNYSVKPKIFLHVCCIGCGAYVASTLTDEYDVTLYFFNPNIYPRSEYELRLRETEKVAKRLGLDLITGEYDHSHWLKAIAGYENDQEKGERCRICYRLRMEEAAAQAKVRGFGIFTTTLTVSPHKDAKAIMAIGSELASVFGVEFLARDFKKQDGFRHACALSHELDLYRQDYCGCEFSRRT